MDAFELLYNNSASIDDVSKPLDGIVLSVCDISKYRYSHHDGTMLVVKDAEQHY